MHFYWKINLQLVKTAQAILISILLLSVSTLHAGQTVDWEYAQKAKIIKYLIGSVNWPSGTLTDDAVNVCLLGKVAKMQSIIEINGSVVNKHKIIVRTTPNIKKAQDHCQLVYVLNSEADNTKKIIDQFAGKPVLLLGDMDHFAQNGGSMNFIIVKNLVAITINVETLKNSHLDFDMKAYNQVTVIPSAEELK